MDSAKEQAAAPRLTIEARKLVKSFGRHNVLRGIDLQVAEDDFLVIFGPNGAGKTTLIRVLSTLYKPTTGQVVIGGWDLRDHANEVRKQIGVVSHQTFLYSDLTAYENLKFYGRMYGVSDLEQRIESLLDRVGLTARMHDRVGIFSRGMQQRLSIARALLHDPPIVLLDEPETGLDQHATQMMVEVISQSLSGQRKTVVMITHSLQRGLEMANRAVILVNGRICYEAKKPWDLETFREAYYQRTGART